jgi:four helix bundle protein
MGSASELDHHLLLCKDLGFLHDEDYKRISRGLIEVRKMLSALFDSIETELSLKEKAAAQGYGPRANG